MHKQAASNLDPQIKVFGVGCPKFVPLIETGHIHDDAIDEAVQEYADKFKTSDIHSLILGCTHYPIISEVLTKHFGKDVALINPALETAKDAATILTKIIYSIHKNNLVLLNYAFLPNRIILKNG